MSRKKEERSSLFPFKNLARVMEGDLHNSKNLRMRKVWNNDWKERAKSVLIIVLFVVMWFGLRAYLDTVSNKKRFHREL